MRLTAPRIPPIDRADWSESEAAIMQPFVEAGSDHNIFRTLLQHPDLMRRWMAFANHVLFKSTLPARERELVILRIGYLCQAGYEWGQHVVIGRREGLEEPEPVQDLKRRRTWPTRREHV